MKIKYKFATETVEIEVADDWGNLVIDLDRQEYNNDHTETRRHVSYDALDFDGDALAVEDPALTAYTEKDALWEAIEQLTPNQQYIIRDRYAEAHPLCELCKQNGKLTPTEEIHHKLPLSEGGTHATENLIYVIDPTVKNQQGNDIGTQYQTGVYYTNEHARQTVERIAEIERGRNRKFHVEIGPLLNYYPAEEYHQNYLENNPGGYCHIPLEEMRLFSSLRIDPGDYQKPAAEIIRDKLTEQQYYVTQENGTEYAFQNEFWDHFAKGIYVDIVTGEPLFSSTDKFESSCGWPAFTKPIEAPSLIELEDRSHGMLRTEVRSRAGDSHLGHVFENDLESPNGVRYCINSASLRFIPYADMEAEGYGYLMDIFDSTDT